jgi:hypothetical protein
MAFFTRNPNRGRVFLPELGGHMPRAIDLHTADGLRLSAWEFHGEPAPATFILIHGWGGAKEVMDDQIVFLRGEGLDVVAIDLRNHGESEGRVTSVGYHEAGDVEAAIRHVRASPHLAQNVFLWGQSMGAVAALRAAERDPSVRGVIAESGYASLRETARHYVRLFLGRIPAALTGVILYLVRRRARIDIEELEMDRCVARITKPSVLFVAGAEDARMPPEIARRLYAACAAAHKALFIAPHGDHARIFQACRPEYEERVRRFVRETLGRRAEGT